MKTDPRLEEESDTADEKTGLLQRMGQAVTQRKLHAIDGVIHFFQRWRADIAPPEEDEDPRGGRRSSHAAEVSVGAIEPARGGGFRRFLVVVALLLAAGIGGMWFSYSLLARTLDSDDLVIEELRDQLAQMEKADKRAVSIQARDQQQLADYKKAVREQEAKYEEYEDRIAQLQQQIAALKARPAAPAVALRAPSQRTAAPPKTGKCTATGSSAAADITRCLDEFNR